MTKNDRILSLLSQIIRTGGHTTTMVASFQQAIAEHLTAEQQKDFAPLFARVQAITVEQLMVFIEMTRLLVEQKDQKNKNKNQSGFLY